MIDTAEAERRVAMQRTQAAVAHARATIDEWDNMSELAKQRAEDEALCRNLINEVHLGDGTDGVEGLASRRILALSDQVRELSHENDGLQAKLCPYPLAEIAPIHIEPLTNKEWRAALQSESLIIRVKKEPSMAMNFGEALIALKAGEKVQRRGWNGAGMFAYLVPAASYPVQTGAAASHFGEGAMVPYRAYLALKTVDGDVATWAPSCSDVLAEDWGIVA